MATAHLVADLVVLGLFSKKRKKVIEPPEPPYDTTFAAIASVLAFWVLPLYFFKLDAAGRKKLLALVGVATFYLLTNTATAVSALVFWMLPLYFFMIDDRGKNFVLRLIAAAALLFLTDVATFVSILVLWVLPLYVFKINSEAKRFAVGVEYASFVNTLTLTLVLLAGATMLLSMVEVGLSTVDALYLVVMTFTTIGYGDIDYPATATGRVVVSLLALGGIAFFSISLDVFKLLREEKLDGAMIKQMGLTADAAAIAALVVNVLGGIGLCKALSADAGMPDGLLDGAYWSIITTTSVGFGDFHPSTDEGKLAVCCYALVTMQVTAAAMEIAKEKLVNLCKV
tara:strand:+ start:396 stop:1418 length:1023 start_codon:yes stop_codon:yes gene_type:complete